MQTAETSITPCSGTQVNAFSGSLKQSLQSWTKVVGTLDNF